jgi:hypothetical protein
MAGSAFRLNPTHVFREPGQAGFRRASLVEASVTMLGRSFRTTIHEGATTNELIEKVARENGGEVTKKYYPEFKTWEITAVRIGDAALVKSSESGIHFSLGSHGIPIAIMPGSAGIGTDPLVVFPNGDELKVGRGTSNFSLWTTSAPFDPQSIKDLDRIYDNRGGVALSRDALDEISRAHGGGRSGKMALEINNILVLNKDTGEILTVSQHASQENPPAAIAHDAFSFSLPNYATCTPACQESRSYVLPQFDSFRGRLNQLVIRTFDGSVADVVRIQMNPFSQDKLDAGLAALPKEQKMIPVPSPLSNTEPAVKSAPPAICMLKFGRENKRDDSGTSPSSPLPASPGAPLVRAKRALWRSDERIGPDASQSRSRPQPEAIPKILPITYDEAAKAWNERRSEPLRLGIPVGAVSLKGPKTWKSGRKKSHPQKAWQMEQVRKVLALAGVLSIIARLLKERARKIAESNIAKKAAKAAKAIKPVVKKPSFPARSASGAAKKTRNERKRRETRIAGAEKPASSRAKLRVHRNAKTAPTLQNPMASSKGKPSRQAARRKRAQSVSESIKPVAAGRKNPVIAKSRGKKKQSRRLLLGLLGLFERKKGKKKITGRAWAGN